MVSTSLSLTEREWDVVAASHENRRLVKDMAGLVASSNYKEGWKFVAYNMDSLWARYLWICAAHIREGNKL